MGHVARRLGGDAQECVARIDRWLGSGSPVHHRHIAPWYNSL